MGRVGIVTAGLNMSTTGEAPLTVAGVSGGMWLGLPVEYLLQFGIVTAG